MTKKINYDNLSIEEELKLRQLYSKQQFLDVNETAFWLKLSPNTVRRFCREGKIVGARLCGNGIWFIDVAKTKKLIMES